MRYSLLFRTEASTLCVLLFLFCIATVILGRYIRNRFFQNDAQESRGGVNSLLGALFGLWGFLLAFTFSNSSAKFENVRIVTVDESNAIRNTILRTDAIPDSLRKVFRSNLRAYTDVMIDYYNAKKISEFNIAREKAIAISSRLWTDAVNTAQLPGVAGPGSVMMSSLTTMFDLAEKRDALLQSGVPDLIIYILFALALAISFIGGFTTPVIQFKEWVVICGFLVMACSIIYATLDLGRPLRGTIQLKTGKERLVEIQRLF
ncbi:hypothetical protein [Flavihumibacter petaseus]|uniref:DUF4239 domain-containing protein n=1 Tax=Flavihumibacter petaseus NBRC 106054 TaxID=1220578 RepID=A0A0E9N1T3_9BACT|nr:hypothetical protein [Flavihumibacter petaseus]GAO43591.1 hypothetical protein FPE01S_02_06970 [Flavihumibacter petaseus NBRC 106054]